VAVTRRKTVTILGWIAFAIIVFIMSGIVQDKQQDIPQPRTIALADSVAKKLYVDITISDNALNVPNPVTITMKFDTADPQKTGGVEFVNGQKVQCDGVQLSFGDQGYIAHIPRLNRTQEYQCVYQHGTSLSTISIPVTSIPVILSPHQGWPFTNRDQGGYTINWIPNNGKEVVFYVANMQSGPSTYLFTSQPEPDNGIYTFDAQSAFTNLDSLVGATQIDMTRRYPTRHDTDFAAVDIVTQTTLYVDWRKAQIQTSNG
jgi:hypothetical protein